MNPTDHDNNDTIVFFDGVCNLCNGAVQFIIKRDPTGRLKFASLQSDYAKSALGPNYPEGKLFSIMVKHGDRILDKSDAVFEIIKHLQSPWPAFRVFKIFPRFIRDAVYSLIGNNRYRLFGRQDQCMIPEPHLKARFVG